MSREEVYVKLNKIFQDVFDDENLTVNDTTTANDIEDWDSLEHVNLIVAIENKFNIKFKVDEVVSLQNVGDTVDLIIERTNI